MPPGDPAPNCSNASFKSGSRPAAMSPYTAVDEAAVGVAALAIAAA